MRDDAEASPVTLTKFVVLPENSSVKALGNPPETLETRYRRRESRRIHPPSARVRAVLGSKRVRRLRLTDVGMFSSAASAIAAASSANMYSGLPPGAMTVQSPVGSCRPSRNRLV